MTALLPDDLLLRPVVPVALLAAVVAVGLLLCVASAVRAPGLGERLRWLPRALVVLVAAVMCLRPTSPAPPTELAMSDADVYLVVDTTASMGATDGPAGTSRLDQARADVVAVLGQLGGSGARASLVTFDHDARTVVPLTSDVGAVARAAALLQPEVAAGSAGTSITVAAPLLNRTLSEVAESHPDRASVLVYLGDGEHTAAGEPASAAPLAPLVQGGLVLGYGTAAGATMPARDLGADAPSGLVLDPATGQPAVSRADAVRLAALADQLGLEHVQRDAGPVPTVPAPVARVTTTEVSDVPGGSTEHTWLAAVVLGALLVLDLAATLVAMVRAGVPRREV